MTLHSLLARLWEAAQVLSERMRRPTTKTPYAYYRHGQRHRGRPVHRIYALVHRPTMHGTWQYYGDQLGNPQMLFTKDFSFWWGFNTVGANEWDDFISSPDKGRWWNAHDWVRTIEIITSWSDWSVNPFPKKGTLGPSPFIPDFEYSQ